MESASLQGQERIEFLDRQIEALVQWCAAQEKLGGEVPKAEAPAPSTENSPSAASEFFNQLELWMEAATPTLRPHLEQAVTDGFVCWLSSDDLSEYSFEFRRDLAERIAAALDSGATGDGLESSLSDDRRDQLVDNYEALMESWFLARSDEYSELPRGERRAYVDNQLQRLKSWDLSRIMTRPSDSDDQAQTWTALAEMVDQWVERAEPERRKTLRRFVTQLQQRLFVQQFQQLMPK